MLQTPSRLSDLIGPRIRALRLARGMSVNSLAAAAGVSAGIVSQIERDRANPSLSTIEKICDALGVATDAVLTAEPPAADPAFVCRANRRSHIQVGAAPILKEMISPPGDRNLRLMLISLPPRSENLDMVMRPGQKAGLVMEGEIRVVVAERAARLFPGDGFQFSSTQPHSLHNDTDLPAKVLWVIAESPADGAF
ncbi:helix-turn-helix domain-containing protein [Roseomonas sp. 18066]|uniref:helix-turn-helix domain-containing protein n=1 Tax=Roseomonas sp. 18066 TaxID=2681412 RepID=UPI00135B6FA5|nr:helix-turn-helix domain-containing protein [Roseomonas sp. 18066]